MRRQSGAWVSLIFPLLRFHPTILNSCCEKHSSWKNGQLMKTVACPHASSLAESPNEIQASDQSLSFTCHIPEVKPCWRTTGKILPGSRNSWWVRHKSLLPLSWAKAPSYKSIMSISPSVHQRSLDGLSGHCGSLQSEIFYSITICTRL